MLYFPTEFTHRPSSTSSVRFSSVAADDDVALPSLYALEPVSRTTRNPGVAATSTRNRGSLPDIFAGPPAMSRQEAHLLSNWRREELRLMREEEDRRGRIAIILSVALLRVGGVFYARSSQTF